MQEDLVFRGGQVHTGGHEQGGVSRAMGGLEGARWVGMR